jgi:hypothetical protein
VCILNIGSPPWRGSIEVENLHREKAQHHVALRFPLQSIDGQDRHLGSFAQGRVIVNVASKWGHEAIAAREKPQQQYQGRGS